ncbi:MAG TPA: hypothetical protein VHC86_09570, partial [Opitutaceae bacterium]|nr:hypothetical protein [Opitutaceae bacterium]
QQARLIASLQANLRQVKGGPDSLGTEIIYDWKAVAAGGDAYLNPQQDAALQAWVLRRTR